MALATITANKLRNAKSDRPKSKTMSEIIELELKYCADSAMLLEQLNSDLLSRRRKFILPELNVSYRQLCYNQKAYSKWVFVDNLPQAIKVSLSKTKWVKSQSGKLRLVMLANYKNNVFQSQAGVSQEELSDLIENF